MFYCWNWKNSDLIREKFVKALDFMGIEIDTEKKKKIYTNKRDK